MSYKFIKIYFILLASLMIKIIYFAPREVFSMSILSVYIISVSICLVFGVNIISIEWDNKYIHGSYFNIFGTRDLTIISLIPFMNTMLLYGLIKKDVGIIFVSFNLLYEDDNYSNDLIESLL